MTQLPLLSMLPSVVLNTLERGELSTLVHFQAFTRYPAKLLGSSPHPRLELLPTLSLGKTMLVSSRLAP